MPIQSAEAGLRHDCDLGAAFLPKSVFVAKWIKAQKLDTRTPKLYISLRCNFYVGWINVKMLSFGECHKIRDCCVFCVNDIEVFVANRCAYSAENALFCSNMNANIIFSILAIIGGIYLVVPSIRLFAHRQSQYIKSIFLLVLGSVLIILGFCGFIFKSMVSFSAILFGIVLIMKMLNQEKSWRGHRFTTAYTMHCSGWILGIGSTIYGILKLLPE